MKKAFLALVFAAIIFSGCIYTANPMDLAAPSKTSGNTPPVLGNASSGTNQNSASPIVLSASEIAKHNSASDCWMIIDSKVYNLSSYTSHPGGDYLYIAHCGKDGSPAFHTKDNRGIDHSQQAIALLANYYLGNLGETISVSQNSEITSGTSTATGNSSRLPGRGDEEEEDD